MEFLCKVCDRSIIEKPSEYNKYIATLRNKDDKSLHKNYTINNINLDEFDRILKDYISHHIKKFVFYFIKLTFEVKFSNNFIQRKETHYFYDADISNMKSYLIDCIEYYKSRGYNFYNINELVIEIFNDSCNMTYPLYLSQLMVACGKRINLNIARKPQLIIFLDRSKNHPSFRKYSHIPFNN